MGTPEFAVESLKTIHSSSHDVVGVVSVPDKPAGRGKKLRQSAVKEFATANHLPCAQPLKLRDPEFISQLETWNADLFVVVAFRMLPEIVWDMPERGTINLHGSLLPQYRGAAPINRAIMNGENETGVSTFFITKEIDTGAIIDQTRLEIDEYATAGDIHDEMMVMGAATLLGTIDKIALSEVKASDQSNFFQDESELKAAPKLFREDCRIDWGKDCLEVHNHIRGLSPYPAAWSTLNGKVVKLFAGKPINQTAKPGLIFSDEKSFLNIGCGSGCYQVLDIQMEGKKRISIADFLRGSQPVSGEVFE
ncbi:MAG: methionyl-tRNA formyltransferase [Flavobacteriales bacterium]|jgi:methionyl-tRNA formyltransferase